MLNTMIVVKMKKSNFSEVKKLTETFEIICSTLCEKTETINKRLKNIEAIIDESARYKIKHLTLYTFSTENWKRPKNEVDFLFNLLSNFLSKKIEHLEKKKIRVKFIGEIQKLPISLKKLIRISEKKTAKNTKVMLYHGCTINANK